MEEQSKKTANMHIVGRGEKQSKLSYEQLNDACNQLLQQNRQLAVRNRELEQFTMNKRLDYLFKVVENSSKFNGSFVADCVNEIEEVMTIPQDKDEHKEE